MKLGILFWLGIIVAAGLFIEGIVLSVLHATPIFLALWLNAGALGFSSYRSYLRKKKQHERDLRDAEHHNQFLERMKKYNELQRQLERGMGK